MSASLSLEPIPQGHWGYAWDDYAQGDPVGAIHEACRRFREKTNRRALLAFLPDDAWLRLSKHPDILRLCNLEGPLGRPIGTSDVATIFGLSAVIVPLSSCTPSVGGKATSLAGRPFPVVLTPQDAERVASLSAEGVEVQCFPA